MLKSFDILYDEHALDRKIKYDFTDQSPVDRRLCTVTGC